MIRIATDVGGTFTDLVAFDEESKSDALKIYTSLIEAGVNSEIYYQPDKQSSVKIR